MPPFINTIPKHFSLFIYRTFSPLYWSIINLMKWSLRICTQAFLTINQHNNPMNQNLKVSSYLFLGLEKKRSTDLLFLLVCVQRTSVLLLRFPEEHSKCMLTTILIDDLHFYVQVPFFVRIHKTTDDLWQAQQKRNLALRAEFPNSSFRPLPSSLCKCTLSHLLTGWSVPSDTQFKNISSCEQFM